MNQRKKILFIIPDGVGIRNYLYSDVIKYLKEQNAIFVFWSTLPKEAFEEVISLHQIEIEYRKIKIPVESLLTRLFRESAVYARLHYNSKKMQNETILFNWRKNNKSFKLKLLYKAAEFLGFWAKFKYKRILWLESKSNQFWSKNIIEEEVKVLKDTQPTSIFITHQRVAGLNPICDAAKKIGINVNTAIYSWDNLPKARLAVTADKYFVWSDYMKQEIHDYYPEINQENVLVVGTPQFEFYSKNNYLISRDDFAEKYKLDVTKKWICFSGDDHTTSPYDPIYLDDLANSINSESEQNIQIIFRRSPADFSSRYDAVLEKHKNIIVSINPMWFTNSDKWTVFFPKFEDVKLLVNIVHHCEIVCNVGSTMALDFAVYNKPALYINYNVQENPNWNVEMIYNFQHFRTMKGFDAVGFINSKEDWFPKINALINNPTSFVLERKNWLEKIVQHPLELNSLEIAKNLL